MASLAGSSDEGFTYLLQKYEAWQRYTASLAHDNEMLRHRAVRAEEALGPLQATESQARQDVTKIRTALHGLQNQHSAYLQAEVANANLNNMVRVLQEELQKANKELQKEKSENERRMADAEDTHTRALTAARAEAEKHVDVERENGKMQLVELKAQLEASHRERHEEIMRIRLEYESRLTRIQANGLASRCGVGTPGPDVAIYRQKLQALEERRKREVMNLQQHLALLEGGRGRGGRSTEGAAVLGGVTNTNQNWKWKM